MKAFLQCFRKITVTVILISATLLGHSTIYYSNNADPTKVNNWWTATNGTGSHPANFTTSGDIFIVQSGQSVTTNGNLTIGAGVTLQVDGTLIISKKDDVVISGMIYLTNTSSTQITIVGGPGANASSITINGTLKTNNSNGVSGSNCSLPATATGKTVAFSPSANYEFAGTANQSTLGMPAIINSLTIKNTGAAGNNVISLAQSTFVNGTADFQNGILSAPTNILTISATGNVTGASDASFVDGQVKKVGAIGAGGFDFPIGTVGVGYMKVGIANVTGATTEFTAQYVRASAMTTFGTAGLASLGVQNVSNCEYWTLNRAVTTSNADVTLYWNSHSPCGGSYLSDPLFGIRIAHYNTALTSWDAQGGGSPSGDASSGSVTWAGVTNFSPFALAALVGSQSSLPVVFNDVKAFEKADGIEIDWSNLTEKDLVNYAVERSSNGVNYTAIAQQSPRSNNNDKQSYVAFDATPFSGSNYYRIKALELSGKTIYTKAVRVDVGRTAQSFSLYPNPVTGKQFSVSINNKQGQYDLKVLNTGGQQVYSRKINHQGGSMTQTIDLPSSVKPGVYNIMISGDNYHESKMFIVQ